MLLSGKGVPQWRTAKLLGFHNQLDVDGNKKYETEEDAEKAFRSLSHDNRLKFAEQAKLTSANNLLQQSESVHSAGQL